MTRLVALRLAVWVVPLGVGYVLVALRRPKRRILTGVLLGLL